VPSPFWVPACVGETQYDGSRLRSSSFRAEQSADPEPSFFYEGLVSR
jgi:hypothetical protein